MRADVKGWTPSTLGAACEINPPRSKLSDLDDDAAVMFIPMAAVDDVTGRVVGPIDRPLREVQRKSYRAFTSGDVLFAKITPCMENGKAAVVPTISNGAGFGSTEFHVLRPRSGVNPEFIWHFVRQESFRRAAESHMTGSVGQLRVPAAYLEAFPIDLPSETVQAEVVRALDSTLQAGRQALGRLIDAERAIDRLRRSALTSCCTGRLTEAWRAANPCEPVAPAPSLTPQALAYANSSANASDFGELPNTWAWWPIEAITERVIDYRGRTPPSQSIGEIPHVRTSNIRDGQIDWATDTFVTEDVYDRFMTRGLPKPGDVLFTMEAPLGEVGVVDRDRPFSIAQRILLMRPGGLIRGEFLAFALQSGPVRRAIENRATGSGVLGIAYKRLRSVTIPVPPPEEQEEILRRLQWLLSEGDRLKPRLGVATERIERGMQAILAKAFSGELVDIPGSPDLSTEAEA